MIAVCLLATSPLTTEAVFASELQMQIITVQLKSATLKELFDLIQSKSNYSFLIRNNDINLNEKVSIQLENKSIEEILTIALKNQKATFEVKNNRIIVYKAEGRSSSQSDKQSKTQCAQQNIKVTGKVVDETTGEPIIGANIRIKGKPIGTSTDIDGNFILDVPANAQLTVSYIGYLVTEIKAVAGSKLVVKIKEDRQTLGEVVVVGYGVQKKVNLTGSVASVSSADIKDRVQSDVLSSVQGTVAGVTIISRPGEAPSINFRGRGNLGASEPLYVIDGAIADATFFSNLDPNSIESISFLKDASSSAIYGSRAAYGVVLVTTKKGKAGAMNVSYSGYVGVKSPTYLPNLVDSWQYAELLNEGAFNRNPNGGKNQVYSDEQIGWFRDGSKPDLYPNTDWTDLVLKKQALTTQHNVNFSGGTEKIKIYTGLGYLYNNTFMPGQDNDRYNLNSSITSDINKWLTLKAGLKFIRKNSENKHGIASLTDFLLVPSIMVSKQSNGEWGSMAGGQQAPQTYIQNNPLRELSTTNWSKSRNEYTMLDLGFDLKPFKGLVISGQGVMSSSEKKNKSYNALQDNVPNFLTGNEIDGTGVNINSMDMYWQSTTNMLYITTAKYDFSYKKSDISVLLGTSYENNKYERLYSKRKDFAVDGLQDIETGATVTKDLPDGISLSETKMLSYFGRINYSYASKYLFEGNLRADASSRFYKKNRWGVFPSLSAGWRINEERFMKDIKWIDNLKLRASVGTLGNINNVGNYDYFMSYNSGSNYSFDDNAVNGIVESKPANMDLGWETVTLSNIGLDIDLFKGKLGIVADYYIKNTNDILLAYNVPVETGIGVSPSQNIGKVQNKGFEMAISHRNKIGDFTYSIAGNFSINKNKVVDLQNSDNLLQSGGQKVQFILKEGESIGSFYGYKTDGLYTQEEIDRGEYYILGRKPNAGDIKYVPQRENVPFKSDITGEDRTIIGKDVPDFTYGLNFNLQYKNLELSVFGQGVSGTMTGFESEQVSAFFLNSNPRNFHLNRWTQENPNPRALYPRIYGGHSLDDYNQVFSDYQLFDADYFRIKTITLGYMIPKNIVSNWGISSLKCYLTAENLFTIRADNKMKDFDPESPSGRGLGSLGAKSIAFGLNLTF